MPSINKKQRENIGKSFLLHIFITTFVSLCCISCTKTDAQKKEFIQKNLQKTNEKVAKKYGELVIPDFVKDGDILNKIQ